jgi:hypothetical protein
MLYMVIEHFRDRNGAAVYQRFRECGRLAPAGLEYIDSWVEPNLDRCFQLMACDDPELLRSWAANWEDLVEFEFVPVIPSREMAARFAPA